MSNAFIQDDVLVLQGTPLELYNLIEEMDTEFREELSKGSNIDDVCRALSGLEQDETYEIRVRIREE